MAKRRKGSTDLPSPEERAGMAFMHVALGQLDRVAEIEKTVERKLTRELDARYRKRLGNLQMAAFCWAVMRMHGELTLRREIDAGTASAAEIAHIETYLLSCDAGLEDAAREHRFEADAVRVLTQCEAFTATQPEAWVNEQTRRLAADVIRDTMKG